MTYPRITLVTASFNQGNYLEQTIQSVLGQDYPDLEYIIIDGGSTDNSVEIIKRYAKHLTYWQSQPDHGQSDALCQGFSRATGTLMNWVNSDDLLAPGALHHIATLYNENPGADIIAGSIGRFNKSPDDIFEKYDSKGWCPEGFLRCAASGSFAFNQPGAFFSRTFFQRVGGLDANLHMCMDYDMFLKMCELGPRIVYTDQIIAYFRHHAGSKTTCGNVKSIILEHAEMLRIYNESFERVAIIANRSRDVNILHWLLFRCICHADVANMRLAYQALRQWDQRSPWDMTARIGALLFQRLFQGQRV
jgi:glycosyltransferase involved in cell wall biosynthesis